MAVAANGDLFVATQSRSGRGTPETGGGVVALHDALDGDGKRIGRARADPDRQHHRRATAQRLPAPAAHPKTIREQFKGDRQARWKPAERPRMIVTARPPDSAQHSGDSRDSRLTASGSLYINVGAPSNACQQPDRRPGVKGVDPCPILEKHGGVWKFDENKLKQTQEKGTKFATGMRQFPAITWHDGAVYIAMNNRDQLDVFWPDKFTAKDNAERPAEPLYRAVQGSNFGWPYCFYDYGLKKKGTCSNPDATATARKSAAARRSRSRAAFPAHWAPVDLMFYSGTQFPKKYQGGAFIAFHGSWNRAPMPQDGYNVTFQPFADGKPSGDFEVFAQGFAGKDPLMNPNDAVARADGVAQAPDGSLYIADSQKGKIWRVLYRK